jgi:hypothetical protein
VTSMIVLRRDSDLLEKREKIRHLMMQFAPEGEKLRKSGMETEAVLNLSSLEMV